MDDAVIPVEGTVVAPKDEGLSLQQHEANSAHRAARIEKKIKHLKEEMKMSTTVPDLNVFGAGLGGLGNNAGMGGAIGGGLGAGLLGGVLGGLLFNRGGLGFGGAVDGNVGGIVTPALLASSLAQVTDTQNNATVLQTLGDIKAAIPYNESQVQLALAGAQADINGNISSSLNIAVAGQAGINKNISDAIATSLASQGAIKETVLTTGAANLTATMNAKFELANALRDDGDKTRALIVAQNDANLQRMLTVAESRGLEDRLIGRQREVEVNVTQNVNQNQAQFQQQQQFQVLANAVSALVAQNQHISQGIVNLGTMTGNSQTAANTRVNS